MKKRLTSLLVLCMMILSTTSALAYDWEQMRGELDIRFQHKDDRGGTDGSGGATRAYSSQKAEIKLMPFEDSEFYFGMGAEFRDYDNNSGRKADDKQSYSFFVGNTYYTRIFGKTLTLNPEVGYENNNRKDSSASEDRSNEKLYLDHKMNLSLNRQWTLFSKTKIEYKKLDYSKGMESNSSWAPDTRLENGAKYRWNKTHTSSASMFYRKSSADASYWGYATTIYQARLKHHWKLADNFTFIPYAHVDLGNSSRNNDRDTVSDKYGAKFKWNVRPDVELYGGAAYERKEEDRSDRTKRYLVTHAGMKYAF